MRLTFSVLRRRVASAFLSASLAVAWALLESGAQAVDVNQFVTYQSSISSDMNGPLDLIAELNYDDSVANAPIAVVMHTFSDVDPSIPVDSANSNIGRVRANAQRLRDAGFFAVSVAMRGRDGSDGVRDSGGLEVYDIYDAVEWVKDNYATQVDPSNIHITGYSGGGGNVMSAITKFPDYFNLGSSFFGISDYGFSFENGWYNNGASSSHQAQLRSDIGGPPYVLGNNPTQFLDSYQARASNLASKNNPYSEIHLFVNNDEVQTPLIQDTTYLNNAVAAESTPGEFDNITLHIGQPNLYQDFNKNNINEPNERQYWPHAIPNADIQHSGEAWYLDRLLAGQIPAPQLYAEDELFVAGFMKTSEFEAWIGDGQNGAAGLVYSLGAEEKSFAIDIVSGDEKLPARLSVETADWAGQTIQVLLNGAEIDSIVGGGVYTYATLGDNDLLVLRVTNVPEPGASCMIGVLYALGIGLLHFRKR